MRPLSRSRCIQRACLSAAFLVSTHGEPSFGQTTGAKALPLVCVLSSGGAISGRGSSPTDLSNYRSGGVLDEDVVNGVPQISQFATVKVDQIVKFGSPDITTETG
jgi:L-asparaginase/Glu-tRNA(Gln) amidotransferase subunit D